MLQKFKNKTIAVIGDSITESGKQFYYLRSYFQNSNDKCYFYNRGTCGNRAVMFPYLFDDEIKELKADYVMISYGVNDLGVWLYDNLKPVTSELLLKRKVRDDEYFDSIYKSIKVVKDYGATPIVLSPFAVNEFIIEKPYIETVADNDEKEDNLKPSFYTRATFKNINMALLGYANKLKEIAFNSGAEYFPAFERTYEEMLKQTKMFSDDGVHYNASIGLKFIAKIMLEYIGCTNIPIEFCSTPENDEIERLEKLERDAGGITRGTPYNKYFGSFTEEEMIINAQNSIKANGWGANRAKLYLKHYKELPLLRTKIKELTEKL